MKKSNKFGFVILIFCVVFVIVIGYYLKTTIKLNENISNEENVNIVDNNENNKEILTYEEKSLINIFINERQNYAFTQINYENPRSILDNINYNNNEQNAEILMYSINNSDFSRNATEAELKVIWDQEMYVSSRIIDFNGVKSYLKNYTNYDYETELITKSFSSKYNEKLGLYIINITDTIFNEDLYVVSGYKNNEYIYVTLNNGIELTLIDSNREYENHYYFYACKVK